MDIIDYSEALIRLRGGAPLDSDCSIRRRKMAKDDMGHCSEKPGDKLSITIATFDNWTREELIQQLQVLTLVHEYAHALSWKFGSTRTPHHGVYFSAGYAEAYAAVFPPEA